jgi:biuret amidohydrolase
MTIPNSKTDALHPEHVALVMIDFQRDFCSEGGYADACSGLDWVKPIIPAAKKLLEEARELGLTVIYTRENYAADLSDCPVTKLTRSENAGARYGDKGPLGRFMIRGEYGNDVIDELKPREDEFVLDKSSYGTFLTTNIDDILKQRKITTLAIAGVTADVCVHTTLREATDRGYDCYYIKDAISAFKPEIRDACEQMILEEGGIWGELSTSDEFIRLFDTHR